MSHKYSHYLYNFSFVRRIVILDKHLSGTLQKHTNERVGFILSLVAEYLFPGVCFFNIWKHRDKYDYLDLPEQLVKKLYFEIGELLKAVDTTVEVLVIEYSDGVIFLNALLENVVYG